MTLLNLSVAVPRRLDSLRAGSEYEIENFEYSTIRNTQYLKDLCLIRGLASQPNLKWNSYTLAHN